MSESPLTYVCASCVRHFSTDGICPDCNVDLFPVDTIQCRKCGSELKKDAKHCSNCGNVLQKSCKNCGTILEAIDTFCPECGKKNEESVLNLPEAKQSNPKNIDIDVNGHELIALMFEPVGLKELREKYPYLTTGPDSEEYQVAIGRGIYSTDEQRIILRLQSSPRFWALLKPGMFRRWFTIAIDIFLWCTIFLFIFSIMIGSDKGGGVIGLLGITGQASKTIFGLALISLWYLIYTAGAEFLLGSTLGGFICGTRVVNEYGNRLSLGEAITRQFWKFFYPLNFIFGPGGNTDYEVVLR